MLRLFPGRTLRRYGHMINYIHVLHVRTMYNIEEGGFQKWFSRNYQNNINLTEKKFLCTRFIGEGRRAS